MPTMRFLATIEMTSLPADVFAVLGDYQLDPRWRRGVLDMRPEPPGPPVVGMTTDEVIGFLGITTRTPGEVTAVIPGVMLAWRAAGTRMAASGTRRVDPADGGARVTLETEIRLHAGWRVVEPLLALIYGRQLRGDLARLKELVDDQDRR
jgi:Polyketide cyclase / dehydrase and lipid transport